MKRSTLILILVALALGAFVYFYEIRDGKARDEAADPTTPAFSLKPEDLAALTVTRTGQVVVLERQNDKWVITHPINAPADQAVVDSLAGDIAGARVERKITASAEEVKSYGLAEPAVVVEAKLKNGAQHRVRLGAKDFSGLSVYGQLDQSAEVALLPASLLTNADKALNDLRDRSVLGVSQYEIDSISLNNENGRVALAKQESNWVIKSPVEAAADQGGVSSLLGDVTSAKATDFVSEAADDLAKYGLDQPKITLTVQLAGGERALTVGAKTENDYFAKRSDRPQVFKIDAALYDKLNTKLSDLRDKPAAKEE